MHSLADARAEVRRSSGGGFAFLIANGFGWLAAGTVGLVLGPKAGAWALLFQGGVTLPLAFGLERALGFPQMSRNNPLLPLVIQLAMTQVIALPAVILVIQLNHALLPVAFAAVVGGHFLPYAWLQATKTYIVLAVVVGLLPWVATMVIGRGILPYLPLAVAFALIAGAFKLRSEVASDSTMRS